MRLLFVDDQKSVHLFCDKMIDYKAIGIQEVEHASNGEEAYQLIREKVPDLMVLDIRMPVMDGLALLEKLHGDNIIFPVIILSAFDEFSYAKKCMEYNVRDYLLKPIDTKELTECLKKYVRKASENNLQQLTQEFARFQNMAPDKWDSTVVPNNFDSCYGCICLTETDTPEIMEQSVIGSFSALGLKILCLKTNDTEWSELHNTFGSASEHGEEVPAMRIGMSHIYKQSEDFWNAVRESCLAYRQSYYNSENCQMFAPDYSWGTYHDLPENLTDRLKQYWTDGDSTGLRSETEHIFQLFQRKNIHPDLVWNICYSSLLQLNSNYIETVQFIQNHEMDVEAHWVMDASGIKNYFLRLLLHMRMNTMPEKVQSDEQIVSRIYSYIETNYEKDLSLGTLSTHFFISKYQISRIFKKKYGINCSDFIVKTRMEAAAILLNTTDYKIDHISELVGYEDSGYFTKVFTRYYEHTPGEYRKNKTAKK